MFDPEEIREWEAAVDERSRRRWCNPKGEPFDPRKEAMIRHRKRGFAMFKESKIARKMHQQHFKMLSKQQLLRDEDWRPMPHDYKTYGILTW